MPAASRAWGLPLISFLSQLQPLLCSCELAFRRKSPRRAVERESQGETRKSVAPLKVGQLRISEARPPPCIYYEFRSLAPSSLGVGN
jgi:hypothetical protein